MPETTTLVTTTILLLLTGIGQVALFKILHLNLRGFIKAIVWIMIISGMAMIFGHLWTFGPLIASISILYFVAPSSIPLIAYVRRAHDLLDLEGLVDSVDKIIAETDKQQYGRQAENIRKYT